MYYQPREISEALDIRARMGADVTPLGGGTDVVVALNRLAVRPQHFLDLSRVTGYSDVRKEDGDYLLAGGSIFSVLGRLPVRALADAAMSVGGPAIRNRGTIAGNLGTASPAGDGCVALLAVDAEIELSHSTRGRRKIPIAEYFTGLRRTALLTDELITAVRVPGDWTTAWQKIGKRGATNISVVCGAVGVSPDGGVRLAFGSVAPTVIRARKAEALVAAEGLTESPIEAAAELVMTEVSPIDDHRASAEYRRAMCGVLARRLLHAIRTQLP